MLAALREIHTENVEWVNEFLKNSLKIEFDEFLNTTLSEIYVWNLLFKNQ